MMDGPDPAPVCAGAALPLQDPGAHVLGETFYLPQPQAAKGCPADLTWEVAAAPQGSSNTVYMTGSTYPRFTPDVAGDYTLRLRGVAGSELALRVASKTPAERFRNHYLTPLYGMGRVNGELWVANGAAYTVSRISVPGRGGAVKVAEAPVGAWPAAVAGHQDLPYVLVANRGSDTLGFLSRERNLLLDALPVGDEPTGLAIAPDGKRAYVSLPTMRQIAVVDLTRREIAARVDVGFDPRALALSADGARLYVASYRSGNLQDGPGKMRPAEQDQDLWFLDTGTLKVSRTVLTVAADLRALALSADGGELYVAATDGDTVSSQADPMARPFVHQVAVVGADPARPDYGTLLRSVDLTRQASAAGRPFVNPAGVVASGDTLWLAAEGSNEIVALDRQTLAERQRVAVCAGPRQLVALDGVNAGAIAVHCFRAFAVWIVESDGTVRDRVQATADPRPADVALGEEVFSRPGGAYAQNHACASCHVETQNDGMVWNFGPRVYHNVRPLQLLSATTPIEWGAYVTNTANFGIQGPSSIMARPPTQAESEGLAAFLSSLLGAPRATGDTLPDGSYSEAALRGQVLFEKKLACAGCHTPGLYTSRQYIPVGKSGEPADVPSLLGVYRHGVYMVKGQARSLADAVDVALAFTKASISTEERGDLVRFLRELTPKGAAPLEIWPDLDSAAAVAPTAQPWVRFSEAVDSERRPRGALPLALQYVVLETATGEAVAGTVESKDGLIRFRPQQPLAAGQKYRFRVLAGLPFVGGGYLEYDRASSFTVAQPAASLPEKMTLTVYIPPMGAGMPIPLPFELDRVEAGDKGQTLRIALGNGLQQRLWAQLSGDNFVLQGFALPLPPRGVADAGTPTGKITQVINQDGGSQVALIEGTLRLGAPGINVPGVKFDIRPR